MNIAARIFQLEPEGLWLVIVVCHALPIFGFIAAVLGLASIGKYGSRGILVSGVIGLLMNSTILGIMIVAAWPAIRATL